MPGRISMSRAFRDALPPGSLCEYRGEVPVKGRGDIEMFFLDDFNCAATQS